MTKDEALKLALEALETYKGFIDDAHIIEGQWHWIDGLDNVQTAIKEALAQDELCSSQEPVTGCACRWNSEGDRVITCERHEGWLEVIAEWADRARDAEKKLKALAQPPEPRNFCTRCGKRTNDIHTCTPPRGLEMT